MVRHVWSLTVSGVVVMMVSSDVVAVSFVFALAVVIAIYMKK